MYTRRQAAAAAVTILTEAALAQRAAVSGPVPSDMAWLNANENPDGPPKQALEAMLEVLPKAGRYHYQEFGAFYAALARSEQLEPRNILIGAGSSEVLQCAVHAFTAPGRPMIAMHPTYEAPPAVVEALSRPVIRVPLTKDYAADVRAMVAAADQAGGGLLYLCNPNNPTSSITTRDGIAWMIANLPRNTVALIDEAYIHFSDSPKLESALRFVRDGKPVVVTRTFSKIWGMAGLRAGFACAPPALIDRMAPFRNNVISIVTARGVLAAIANRDAILAERLARFRRTRDDLTAWLRSKKLNYIEPNANFVMIDLGREVRSVTGPLIAKGVAAGRPFPPMDNWMRLSIGAPADMEKFKRAFSEVWG